MDATEFEKNKLIYEKFCEEQKQNKQDLYQMKKEMEQIKLRLRELDYYINKKEKFSILSDFNLSPEFREQIITDFPELYFYGGTIIVDSIDDGFENPGRITNKNLYKYLIGHTPQVTVKKNDRALFGALLPEFCVVESGFILTKFYSLTLKSKIFNTYISGNKDISIRDFFLKIADFEKKHLIFANAKSSYQSFNDREYEEIYKCFLDNLFMSEQYDSTLILRKTINDICIKKGYSFFEYENRNLKRKIYKIDDRCEYENF